MNNPTIQSVYLHPSVATGLHAQQQSSPPLLQISPQLPISQQQLSVTVQRPSQSLSQPLYQPPQLQLSQDQYQKMNSGSSNVNVPGHRPGQLSIDQVQQMQHPQMQQRSPQSARQDLNSTHQQQSNSPQRQNRELAIQAQLQAQLQANTARRLSQGTNQQPQPHQASLQQPSNEMKNSLSPSTQTMQEQNQPHRVPQLPLQVPPSHENFPSLPPHPTYVSNANKLSADDLVSILTEATPNNIDEYSKHMFEILTLIHNNKFENNGQSTKVMKKYDELITQFSKFTDVNDPINSKVYLVIQTNFDLFIKIITNHERVDLATKTIRFLTNLLMNSNYWEIYNLLQWKPAIYHFLLLIQFDIHECYAKFIHDYSNFNYQKSIQPKALPRKTKRRFTRRTRASARVGTRGRKSKDEEDGMRDEDLEDEDSEDEDMDDDSLDESESYTDSADHDKYGDSDLSGSTPKGKRRSRGSKSDAHRLIKKTSTSKPSNKSSNYDPDVVHECQLPSPDEPHKLCLRRFSRKYELIRHQETVHSKKKKLFKCFVCVKQNPGVGPRIFTRHDTLAKHIRVNHKISGKEAKAEVAYSKKNAEVVEEGDITVHVGRRKTKVDFELRAHMEKRKGSRDDDDIDLDEDMYSDMDSGDEVVTFNVPKTQ